MESTITRLVLSSAFVLAFSGGSMAQAQKAPGATKPDKRQEEITAHRRMAEVHENAAKCLEAGRTEKECHDQLQKECKGVGIGKHCGMRHAH